MTARMPCKRRIVTLLVGAVAVGGCGSAPVLSPSGSLHLAATAPPTDHATLPGPDELIPPNVEGATPWIPMRSLPNGFETDRYASPDELAETFAAAILAGWAGSPQRPEIELHVLGEWAEAAVVIASETGAADDSVAGTQYALVMSADDAGWALEELWTRALCRRGVDGALCV